MASDRTVHRVQPERGQWKLSRVEEKVQRFETKAEAIEEGRKRAHAGRRCPSPVAHRPTVAVTPSLFAEWCAKQVRNQRKPGGDKTPGAGGATAGWTRFDGLSWSGQICVGAGSSQPDRIPGMANHHFGKFADVWKHLALVEVLALERPSRYAETHSGSGANAMLDDPERRFGVRRFLELADTTASLEQSRYRALLKQFGDVHSFYPGSALLAMAQLGASTSYLLCDLDPVSVGDLRAWTARLGITQCEVAQADGMMTVLAWLDDSAGSATPSHVMVHVDPFDPHSHPADGLSALDLAARLADEGYGLVYWYGYDSPDQASWAYHTLSTTTQGSLWCGDVMLVDETGAGRPGDLGRATAPGTGCGIVLANVSEDTRATCLALGEALATAYAGSTFPDGTRGRVRFSVHERR